MEALGECANLIFVVTVDFNDVLIAADRLREKSLNTLLADHQLGACLLKACPALLHELTEAALPDVLELLDAPLDSDLLLKL